MGFGEDEMGVGWVLVVKGPVLLRLETVEVRLVCSSGPVNEMKGISFSKRTVSRILMELRKW